jgi:hypothetical protein
MEQMGGKVARFRNRSSKTLDALRRGNYVRRIGVMAGAGFSCKVVINVIVF